MNRTSESGVFLVHAVFISTIAGLIGLAFISNVLSETITSRAYLQAESTIIQAEAVLEKVAWMLATPGSSGGWGIRMTTAPSGESVDEAFANGHFTELDGAKVILQRTAEPWERRVTLVVERSEGRIHSRRTIQSSVWIRVSGGRLPDAGIGGTALVALDGPDGAEVSATLVSTDLSISNGSPAVWVGHGRELSLWGSSVSGDIWSHLPVSIDPWSIHTGDALVTGYFNRHSEVFPELVPSLVFGQDPMSNEEMFVIQQLGPQEKVSGLNAVVCPDDDGRIHVSVDGLGCGSDIDLLVDRWLEPPRDGVLSVIGDVTIDGAIPDGWIVIAAGGPQCSNPCGRLTYLAGGRADGAGSDLETPSFRSRPMVIGGAIEVLAATGDALLTADVFSTGSLRTGVGPAIGDTAEPVLTISSMIVSGGAIQVGGPDHHVTFDQNPYSSNALEVSRTGIRPKALIGSWKEVLPAHK